MCSLVFYLSPSLSHNIFLFSTLCCISSCFNFQTVTFSTVTTVFHLGSPSLCCDQESLVQLGTQGLFCLFQSSESFVSCLLLENSFLIYFWLVVLVGSKSGVVTLSYLEVEILFDVLWFLIWLFTYILLYTLYAIEAFICCILPLLVSKLYHCLLQKNKFKLIFFQRPSLT